ncbi:ABC transporter ATP-binding protein uup [compost metagenome]
MQDWLIQSRRSREIAEQQANAQASKAAKEAKEAKTTAPAPTATSAAAPVAQPKRKLSYKDQRELDQLPARIAALETEQKAIQAELADGSLYNSDYERAVSLQQRDAVIEEELLEALMRWEELAG